MARSLAILALVVFGTATIQSCRGTRNPDGSITLEFAPDMTVTAYGLEDALSKLIDLLGQCTAGTWNRRCTDQELTQIGDAIARILDRKGRISTN